MKPRALTLFICLISFQLFAQENNNTDKINLDFEQVENDKLVFWSNMSDDQYKVYPDSMVKRSGKYSACIDYQSGSSSFRSVTTKLPNNYAGKEITLSGYIKTEQVKKGRAGFWVRIDPEIGFDNMSKQPIEGTTDWKKYSITLKMNPEKTTDVFIGALLIGEGKMWIDDLSIQIDGKDISEAEVYEADLSPAQKDNEFAAGSLINSIEGKEKNIENLYHLGLIWGFTKYHHPEIAKGNFNMDYELFRIMPKILVAKNSTECDALIVDWINHFGSFKKGKKAKFKKKEIKLTPDLDWIKNSGYSKELESLLVDLRYAKRSSSNYYIDLKFGVRNPDFTNEEQYKDLKNLDAGFRMLTLYRYWNMIQYYFPNRHLIEKDWKDVLKAYIPQYIVADNNDKYTLTTLSLIGEIHDTHANIWGQNNVLDKYWGNRYAAVELSIIGNKMVVSDFYDEELWKETGLKIGDEIQSIYGQSFEDILNKQVNYLPASNHPTKLRDLSSKLLRSNDSLIHIEFNQDKQLQSTDIKTFPSTAFNVYKRYLNTDTCFRMINKDIAYVNNGSLKGKYLPEIWEQAKDSKGLIIDIRNYPSDFPIFKLSKYLLPNKTDFVKFSSGSIKHPGYFTFKKGRKVGSKNKDYYQGKVIILINETTQSSAEYHTMAYQTAPQVTIIGSTTAGADGNVSKIILPGGIYTMISGIGVYYPDGSETQRIGIVPDLIIQPSMEGIKSGKDEVLEKAIELIQQ